MLLFVEIGETVILPAYLKLENSGRYVIRGYALYEGKTTESKEVSFTVETGSEPNSTSKSKPFLEIPSCGALGAALAAASVAYLLRIRKRSV